LLRDLRAHPLALGLAIALHVLIILLLVLRFGSDPGPLPAGGAERPVEIVQAHAVDARQFDAAIRRQREAEKRKAELEKRRAAERRRKEAERKAAEARKRKEARRKKRLAEEKRRAAEERRRREAERKARAEAERAAEQKRLAEALAAEAAALEQQEAEARRRAEVERQRAAHLSRLRADWVDRIRACVQASWRRPPGARAGDVAHVYITQTPAGMIVNVRVASCSGSAAFCKSVEAAVLRAEPLPRPSDPAVFERELHFIFEPLGG